MNTVHILSTGGTFEKTYDSGMGVRNFSFSYASAVEDIIERHDLEDLSLQYDSEYAKDNIDTNGADDEFDVMVDWCNEDHHHRCIIILGTDTMVKIAKALAENCPGKVIILTGALQPACMRDSDAELNLGGALVAARLCTPGVYIAMHGNVYPWDNCQKGLDGKFRELAPV